MGTTQDNFILPAPPVDFGRSIFSSSVCQVRPCEKSAWDLSTCRSVGIRPESPVYTLSPRKQLTTHLPNSVDVYAHVSKHDAHPGGINTHAFIHALSSR